MSKGVAANDPAAVNTAPIRVKLLSSIPVSIWLRQFPDGQPRWGALTFTFDRQAQEYDWLVVYDDVPPLPGQKRSEACEALFCHPSHTLLITTEPSSIKHYGLAYTNQFGVVLTSQASWALPHPKRLYGQAGLHWFYGVGAHGCRSFRQIVSLDPMHKSKDLSMVFSPKRMRHTWHHRRFKFMRRLMELLPEMDVFGREARPLDDKAEALDAYRYHVALENHCAPHHWTEKLADAFLGLTLPFYWGCPNAEDYFPPDSFIPIDIRDPEGAARIIRRAIARNEYERRLPAILEARRRVLYEYNLFAVLARELPRLYDPHRQTETGQVLYSRHALRRNVKVAWQDLVGKARAKLLTLAGY